MPDLAWEIALATGSPDYEFPGTFSPRGIDVGTPGGLTLAANVAYWSRFTVDEYVRANEIRFFLSTVDAANPTCDVGVYDETLNRLVNAGAATGRLNAGTVKSVTIPEILLHPGRAYYAAISSASAGVAVIGGLSTLNANYGMLFSGAGGGGPYVAGGQTAASHPLPAGPLAWAAVNPVPWLAVLEV